MPGPRDKPIVLTSKAFQRVRRAVNRVNATAWSGDPRNGPATPINPGVMRARVTSAISSGTFFDPGAGAVQIYHKTFDTGEWDEDGDPVACLNQLDFGAGGVAVDTTCFVAWISGDLWLIQADCAATPVV